ncbi:InlB B-repeat-containing protein [Natranaerofaba carboxydovora]|uniref:InlB B-repeat-containing protein n=1 Tax=Natranaerofaba carboxydovora TaxID=2742683 RepID=UPI001F146AB1|nr:carboxypeptidase regulatory-like domain-containing protein [Natranaerofaba carboxydovora]UMZ72513.1 The GLUG motif protein [Natranaerofaba carboxydovora]
MNIVKSRKVMFALKIIVITIIFSFSSVLSAPSSIETLEDGSNETINKSFPSLTPYIMGSLGYRYSFIPYSFISSLVPSQLNHFFNYYHSCSSLKIPVGTVISEEKPRSIRNKRTARKHNPYIAKITEVKDKNSLKNALNDIDVKIISFKEDIGNDDFTVSVSSQTVEGNGKILNGDFTIEADDITIKNLNVLGNLRDNGTGNTMENISVNSNSPGGNVILAGNNGTVKDTVIQNDLTLQGSNNKINNSSVGRNVIITGNGNDYRSDNVIGTFLYSVNGQTFPEQTGLIVKGPGLFEESELVTIKAKPKEGFEFSKWNSDGVFFSDNFSLASTFEMPDKPVTITAIFQETVQETEEEVEEEEKEEYVPITLSISGKVVDQKTSNGIQGALIYIENANGSNIETITKEDGTYYVSGLNPGTYTIKAVAEDYSKFFETHENLDKDIYVEIDLEKVINHQYYDLVLTINGQGQANLEAGILHTYKNGEEIALLATPLKGWKFDGWQGDLESDELEVIVTMDETKHITANFVRQEYTVVFKDYDNTELKAKKVKHGDNAIPPPLPNRKGYVFYRWEPSDLTNITQDMIITAEYKEVIVKNIVISSPPNKTVYIEGENLQLDGLTVILNKTDDSTEVVEFWEFDTKGIATDLADGTPLIRGIKELIITHPESDRTTAQDIVVIPVHKVNFDTEGEGGLIEASINGTTINSGDVIAEGSTIIFTASPDAGLQAAHWTINDEVSDEIGDVLTIKELDSDLIVKVGFDVELIPIATADELKQIESYSENTFGYGTSYQRQYRGGYHKNYFLVNDIDLNQINFEPIGYESGNGFTEFSGTFDGRGYKIHNGTIDFPKDNYIGLFASTSADAVIENIGLENIDIKGWQYVGSLAGQNTGSVKHSYSANYVETTYTSNRDPGYIGGLVGANDGVIKKSYNTGAVTGHIRHVGGLVGDNNGTIKECYNTGALTGDTFLGGLSGRNEGRIEDSYNTGSVTGGGAWTIAAGGLVGDNSNFVVKNSYSTGRVIGPGGLIGGSGDDPTIINSYWDKGTSGKIDGTNGEGKETSEMLKQETFIGWGFSDIWGIKEGKTYPYLKNNPQNPLPKPPPS